MLLKIPHITDLMLSKSFVPQVVFSSCVFTQSNLLFGVLWWEVDFLGRSVPAIASANRATPARTRFEQFHSRAAQSSIELHIPKSKGVIMPTAGVGFADFA